MRLRAIVVLIVFGFSLALSSDVAGADTASDEQAFVAKINHVRALNGLPALVVDNELRSEAQAWAHVMANDQQLKHSNALSRGISADWVVLGENVGVHGAPDVDVLFAAFVNSPSHLDNLLDSRYQYVGVGVVYDENGQLWTTHRFMSVNAAQPAATTPPPATQPPATRPAATQPPATRPAATQPPATQPSVTAESLQGLPTPDVGAQYAGCSDMS